MTMMMLITIDDDHDGHDDDAFLAGWGSFEAGNFCIKVCNKDMQLRYAIKVCNKDMKPKMCSDNLQ